MSHSWQTDFRRKKLMYFVHLFVGQEEGVEITANSVHPGVIISNVFHRRGCCIGIRKLLLSLNESLLKSNLKMKCVHHMVPILWILIATDKAG